MPDVELTITTAVDRARSVASAVNLAIIRPVIASLDADPLAALVLSAASPVLDPAPPVLPRVSP